MCENSLAGYDLFTECAFALGDSGKSAPYILCRDAPSVTSVESRLSMELPFHDTYAVPANPIETIEAIARLSDLDAVRASDTELHVNLSGSWRDVSMWFAWRAEAQVLQIGAPLEMRVPAAMRGEVHKLLALINERLWLGHFDLWDQDQGLIYRNGAVLPEGQTMDSSQAEILLRGAMEAFEKFYPAFNYVVWGGKTAEEALEASILETVGNA